MPEQPSITLESRGGIHGTLRYAVGTERYSIPYEYTGEHRSGIIVFIKELDAQLQCEEPLKRRSQIRRDLQSWSKQTGERLSW
jgi:hypothetical protein